MQQSIVGAANLVDLACGPICIGLFGLGGAIMINAISFFLCGGIICFLQKITITSLNHAFSAKTYLLELKEGFRYTKNDHLLINICFFACLINAMAVPIMAFQAPYMKDYFHMGSEGIAILGIGEVLGMILISTLILKVKICYRNMFIWSGTLAGGLYVMYAFVPMLSGAGSYIALASAAFLMGVLIAMLNFPIQVAVYGRVEQSYLARFSSLMGALCMGAQPLASFLFGLLSKTMSLPQIYLICGLLMTLFFSTQFFNKTLHELNQY